jgi:hypothetical protein
VAAETWRRPGREIKRSPACAQLGQSAGALRSFMARNSVNGPQCAHWYSYKGMRDSPQERSTKKFGF